MTTRFCPRCENEVHDAGGYCLLGHKLALEPLDASLSDLRDEIDQAFEDARVQVAAVVSGTEITEPMPVVRRTPPPPPPAAPRPRRAGPPPPPPPRQAIAPAQPAGTQLEEAPRAADVSRRPVAVPLQPTPVAPRQSHIAYAPAPAVPAPAAPPQSQVVPAPAALSPESQVVPAPARVAPEPAFPGDPSRVDTAPAPAPEPDDFPREDEVLARKYPVWKDLEEASPLIGDPIGAFAPRPHMDWGPDKAKKLLKRRPSRQSRETPDAP